MTLSGIAVDINAFRVDGGRFLTVPGGVLPTGENLVFTLTVSKGEVGVTAIPQHHRTSSTSVTVRLVYSETPVPVVGIAPFGLAGAIQATARTQLAGTVSYSEADLSTLSYKWTLPSTLSGNLDSATDRRTLVLPANAMAPGSSYQFVFTASDIRPAAGVNVSASARVQLRTFPNPAGGALMVTPATGVAGSTPFRLDAANWTVPDAFAEPLTYRFGYRLTHSLDQSDEVYMHTRTHTHAQAAFCSRCTFTCAVAGLVRRLQRM